MQTVERARKAVAMWEGSQSARAVERRATELESLRNAVETAAASGLGDDGAAMCAARELLVSAAAAPNQAAAEEEAAKEAEREAEQRRAVEETRLMETVERARKVVVMWAGSQSARTELTRLRNAIETAAAAGLGDKSAAMCAARELLASENVVGGATAAPKQAAAEKEVAKTKVAEEAPDATKESATQEFQMPEFRMPDWAQFLEIA